MRRHAPALVAAIALATVGAGLWSLGHIFARERDETDAAIEAERRALAHAAHAGLARTLAARLAAAAPRFQAAASDPLADRAGLWIAEPAPVVPGLATSRGAAAGPATERTVEPARGLPTPTGETAHAGAGDVAPERERADLRSAVLDALKRRDDAAVTRACRDLLAHRMRHVLDPRLDLPAEVGVIEALVASGRIDRSLLRQWLRDGVRAADGTVVPGLQRSILTHRGAFAAADLTALADRVVAVSRVAGVPSDDFVARVADPPRPMPPVVEPVVTQGAYFEPDPSRGLDVDASEVVATVARALQGLGVLRPEDAIVTRLDGPLAGLAVGVESPRWAVRAEEAGARFRLKTALLAGCGALSTALVAVALSWNRRRRRRLDLQAEFLATVSHELRTPLASMRLLAETLARRLRDEPRAADYPQRIVRDAEGLGFLVENILSFSRLERGRVAPRLRPVRLVELVASVRAEVEAHADRPVVWRLDALEDLEITVDSDLLQLLLHNLFRNACQHNERDPVEVTVAATQIESGWRLTVADNGVGLPPAEHRRVFEPFHRAGARGRGSGLGLAIARRVASAHRGTLRIADSDPEGTTFELRVPGVARVLAAAPVPAPR